MTDGKAHTPRLAQATGVALAGGQSRRMGADKAGMRLGGQTLIARAVERLGLVFERVIVIGPGELSAYAPGAPIFADEEPGQGPLGGLATALRRVESDWLFLAACDMPFIQPGLVRSMAEQALGRSEARVVAMRGPKGWEPLHAMYQRSVASAVERALVESRLSLRALLDEVGALEVAPADVARLDPQGISAFNANTPEEWAWAQRLAAGGG